MQKLLKVILSCIILPIILLVLNTTSISTGAEMNAVIRFDAFSTSELISHEIESCALKFANVPSAVAYSQARVESNFIPGKTGYDPTIVSTGGDIGIFQIRVPAARDCHPELKEVPDTIIKLMLQHDIKFNIRTYFMYMHLLQEKYGLNIQQAITAYNSGVANYQTPTQYITKVEYYVRLIQRRKID